MADIIASHEKGGWDQGRVFVAGVGGRVGIRTGGPNGSGLLINDPARQRCTCITAEGRTVGATNDPASRASAASRNALMTPEWTS